MVNSRPPILNPVKRVVRRRCGSGCVICGCPLYEYEPTEKTKDRLPVELELAANSEPHNLRNGVSDPYSLHFYGPSAAIDVGGNTTRVSGQTAEQGAAASTRCSLGRSRSRGVKLNLGFDARGFPLPSRYRELVGTDRSQRGVEMGEAK